VGEFVACTFVWAMGGGVRGDAVVPELDMGRVDPRVGSSWVGSGHEIYRIGRVTGNCRTGKWRTGK